MNHNQYTEEMKRIQENMLDYFDDEVFSGEKYQNLKIFFSDIEIHENPHKIKSFLHFLSTISSYHHRKTDFLNKIETIIQLFKDDMDKYFSNSEIFNIFKNSKRILLYLFEKNIIFVDQSIVKKIITDDFLLANKYPQYFQPEIKPFINEKWFPKYDEYHKRLPLNSWVSEIKKDLPDDFYENRKIGENDDIVCKMIRKDLIDEFIIFANKNFYPIKSTVNPSIYETNNFLLKNNKPTLIEYSAFFGSIQIFNYLRLNGVELTPSLYDYAIHSQNAEIINLLEENGITIKDELCIKYIKESIKCHYNAFVNYIRDNYLPNQKEYSNEILIYSLKYYNFAFMQNDIIDESFFCYFCKYDYYLFAVSYINEIDLDINKLVILKLKIIFKVLMIHILMELYLIDS